MPGKFHDQTVYEPQLALVQYTKEHAVVARLDRLSKLCDLLRFGNNQQVSTLRIFRVSAERTAAEQPDGPVGESIAVSSHKLTSLESDERREIGGEFRFHCNGQASDSR